MHWDCRGAEQWNHRAKPASAESMLTGTLLNLVRQDRNQAETPRTFQRYLVADGPHGAQVRDILECPTLNDVGGVEANIHVDPFFEQAGHAWTAFQHGRKGRAGIWSSSLVKMANADGVIVGLLKAAENEVTVVRQADDVRPIVIIGYSGDGLQPGRHVRTIPRSDRQLEELCKVAMGVVETIPWMPSGQLTLMHRPRHRYNVVA